MNEFDIIEERNRLTRIQRVGATTKFISATDTKGERVKITMASRSKTVNYSYGGDDNSHIQAIQDAWEFFEFGELGTITYVADSESGRGSVYVITYEGKG